MNRLQEIDHKHDIIRDILDQQRADALWIMKTRNIAWFTAGADASIPLDTEYGVYSIFVTRENRAIVTSNIEYPRLRDEEGFEALGFTHKVHDWHGESPERIPGFLFQPDASQGLSAMSFNIIPDSGAEVALFPYRTVLMEPEQERLRALGADAAAALEEAITAARPGDTEWQIASRLDAACRVRGGVAIVNLVATDERIASFRHPLVTGKTFNQTLMMVVCMRRGGLIVAATRFAHIGALPDDLREKVNKVAALDAAAMVGSKPGKRLGDVFQNLVDAYATQGEAGQWQQHHQGGLIGYNSRERVATPGDATVIEVGNAFAWNPSIVGCKSEDTLLLAENGFEIVTAHSDRFPSVMVEIEGQSVRRPGVLEI